jgi:hypothetical protein
MGLLLVICEGMAGRRGEAQQHAEPFSRFECFLANFSQADAFAKFPSSNKN